MVLFALGSSEAVGSLAIMICGSRRTRWRRNWSSLPIMSGSSYAYRNCGSRTGRA